jgi:hypothetical protein
MRSLRRRGYRLIARSCRSVYASLSDTSPGRLVLDRLGTPYVVSEGKLVVLGDVVDDVSELFRIPAAPLLPAGRIARDDPPARQITAAVIESLLPPPNREGEYCCVTTTGVLDNTPEGENEEYGFLRRVIRLRGYQPLAISSATALALAELVEESLTGVGMTFGAAGCEAALVHRGVEIARCTVRRGGDWIDEQLARQDAQYIWDSQGHRYLDVRGARRWKESGAASVLEPMSQRERLLSELFRELIHKVLQTAREAFASASLACEVPQPLSAVCSGGTASHPGFRDIVLDVMRTTPLPVDVKEVRVVNDWEYTVARGCLIRAVFEAGATEAKAA